MRSTPVSAIEATVSNVTPPDASSSTSGAVASRTATAARSESVSMLSSKTISGRAANTFSSCATESTLCLDHHPRQIMAATHCLQKLPNKADCRGWFAVAGISSSRVAPRNAKWLSLIITASKSPVR